MAGAAHGREPVRDAFVATLPGVTRGYAPARAFGRFVAEHHRWFLLGWLAVVLVMGYLSTGTARLLSPSGFSADTEASRAADILRTDFPQRKGPVLYAVFSSPVVSYADAGYQAQLAAWKGDLERAVAGSNAEVVGPLLSLIHI